MLELVIIGYGNTLRQDDGFGPHVVSLLSERISDPRISLLSPATLTPELALTLANCKSVIFVDACATLEAGEVEHRQITVDPTADVSLVHSLSPEALLLWTERIYGRSPSAETWLVGVSETDLSDDLTPLIAAQAVAFVDALALKVQAVLA